MTLFIFEIDIEVSDTLKNKFGEMLKEPNVDFAETALKRRLSNGMTLIDSAHIKIVSVRKKK